ncbi:hypothetical protein Tco_0509628 [Tanacetum coccineum]
MYSYNCALRSPSFDTIAKWTKDHPLENLIDAGCMLCCQYTRDSTSGRYNFLGDRLIEFTEVRSHFDIEEQSEEEVRETMTETMEQYMSKTQGDYGGSEHEDANEHIKKVLEIVDLFHVPKITQDQIMLRAFPGVIPSKTAADAKIAIQEMTEYSSKWHNRTSSRTKSTETSDGLADIQAQLNNLGREIKKVNEKVYVAQVACELCKGPHYTKDCPQKKEGKTLEEAYYTQFGAPYQPGGQYRAVRPGFYQRNNGNSSYPDRRPSLEESLTKFMAESAKMHEENSNIIKEIRASTDASIRNQGASIKTLEIQGLARKRIHRIGCGPYAVSGTQHMSILSETVPFPRRLQNFGCDDWTEAQDVKILDAYDHTLPQKEKDPGSFTLPCFIHNICFDKSLVDLGASFTIIDGDDITKDVVLGMKFCKRYASCQMIMRKFAHGDGCERIEDE